MPGRPRPNPKTREKQFRVLQIPEPLRDAVHQRRKKRGQTVQEFLCSALDDELDRRVATLVDLGIRPCEDTRPAKWPLDDRILANLKSASECTGIPASRLLLACLQISVDRKRRPSARKR